ncbi:lactosylceramide 1,3-N-acetyl-beta-D-glucosaminyltransferase-like [Panulirus ornatus]|uniref:lactosylceramide 1,3-N-acetyl-beta-D-glucosaminyltransferase-like n=1 Tax=Panulirus ornatus TaxID=150431 RepID=UPI003A872658
MAGGRQVALLICCILLCPVPIESNRRRWGGGGDGGRSGGGWERPLLTDTPHSNSRPWQRSLAQALDDVDSENFPRDLESNSETQNGQVTRPRDPVDPIIREEEDSDENYDDVASENGEWNLDYDWEEDNYKKYEHYVKHTLFSDVYRPQFLVENHGLCSSESKVFVFINTRVNNSVARRAIRENYLKDFVDYGIPYGFLISSPEGKLAMQAITEENDKFKDLIVLDSKEMYDHLTLKTAHLLHWASHNCPDASYIVKLDDDVYVNVARLLQVLDTPRDHTILGKVCTNCVPLRGSSGGHHGLRLFSNTVTRRHMPLTRFPPFLMGPSYVITADVITLLLEAAQAMTYFSYEDVFWTGLAVEVINTENGINLGVAKDPDSIKEKFRTMTGDRPPAIQVRREDVPGWRVDRRRSETTRAALDKARLAVIVHGINWHADRLFVSAIRDIWPMETRK